MPVMMIMQWDGITPEHYDQARALVNWEGDPPPGGIYHVAAFDGASLRVTDVWESAEQFQQFAEQRLIPGTKQLGLPGEAKVEIYPVHRIHAPAYQRVT